MLYDSSYKKGKYDMSSNILLDAYKEMTNKDNLVQTLIDIQDHLVPILDTYEQALYHHILRHTLLVGKRNAIISVKTANIGLGKSKAGSLPSETQKAKKLRTLVEKGCVEIVERSHKGTEVRPIYPKEIPGLVPKAVDIENPNIEEVDFFEARIYVDALLEREGGKCFYTLQKINRENCVLDHVVPQSKGGDNSYRNIVASSFDSNSNKGDKNADDFARELYRSGILNLTEMQELLKRIEELQEGKLVPQI